jgi:hypothetical protein
VLTFCQDKYGHDAGLHKTVIKGAVQSFASAAHNEVIRQAVSQEPGSADDLVRIDGLRSLREALVAHFRLLHPNATEAAYDST